MNICATSIHVSGSESRRRGPDVASEVNERKEMFRQLRNRRLIQLSGIDSPAEKAVIAMP